MIQVKGRGCATAKRLPPRQRPGESQKNGGEVINGWREKSVAVGVCQTASHKNIFDDINDALLLAAWQF